MSLLLTTSPQHCAKQQNRGIKGKKKLFYSLSTLILTLLSLILILWLMLHPSKPQFYLRDAAIYNRAPINSTVVVVEVAVVATNTNSRVGVYYDRLRVYAAYEGNPITDQAEIPGFFQGQGEANILSAAMYGSRARIAAFSGVVVIRVRVDGMMRWKVGRWVSRRYRIEVECEVAVGIGAGGGGGGVVGLAQGARCTTGV